MSESLSQIYCRPTELPIIEAPISLRSVGFYFLPENTYSKPKIKKYISINFCQEGFGYILSGKNEYFLDKDHIVITLSGKKFGHKTESENLRYMNITFDGPLAMNVLSSFGLSEGSLEVENTSIQEIEALKRTLEDPLLSHAFSASCMVYRIIANLKKKKKNIDTMTTTQKAIAIIRQNWSSVDLNIEKVAEELDVFPSRLSKVFLEEEGITPSKYLTHLRLHNAIQLLKFSQQSIVEVAESCGYADSNYFSKIVKKNYGKTPMQIRNEDLE